MELAMLWVLNLSDGENSLLDIAEHARIKFDSIYQAAIALQEHGLLTESLRHSSPNPQKASA
jgi:aminopeptidase-like protein